MTKLVHSVNGAKVWQRIVPPHLSPLPRGEGTWFVPDERQHVRIRLKLALVDVRTGDWSVLSPPPFDSNALSVGPRRAVADQKLVERLKNQAYGASVEELVRVYSNESLSANRAN